MWTLSTSDGDRFNDTRSESLDRLRRCCFAFGAAPVHPDWIDVSCNLRDGIREEDATGSALEALRSLTQLALSAYLQFRKHSLAAVKGQFRTIKDEDDDQVSLCIRLCNWANVDKSKESPTVDQSHTDKVDWKDTLSSMFGISQEVVEVLLGNSSARNIEEARAAWCPNCSQQSGGKLQDRWLNEDGSWDASTPELRACGEWGLLLAQSLTNACLDMQYGSPYHATSAMVQLAEHPGHEDMISAQLWRNVMAAAISNLMPAAALLRVGLGGAGRKPHPFCFQTKFNEDEEIASLEFSEELPKRVSTSFSQRAAVFDTISLLSHLSPQMCPELSSECRAVASHLLVETKSFADLVGIQSVTSAIGDLKAVQGLRENTVGGSEQSKNISLVTEMLSSVILKGSKMSGGDADWTKLAGSQDCHRLMALLGDSKKGFVVDTIVHKGIEPMQAFIQAEQLEPINVMHTPNYNLAAGVIEVLVRILCKDMYSASDRTREHVGNLLSAAVHRDFFPKESLGSLKIVPTLIASFNVVDKQKLTSLVLKDLCCLSKNRVVKSDLLSLSFRQSIASVLCFLLLSTDGNSSFKYSRMIFDRLDNSLESWSSLSYEDRAPVVEVLLLYACRFNALKEVGSKLVGQSMKHIGQFGQVEVASGEVRTLSNLFGYVCHLRESLSGKRKEVTQPCQLQNDAQPKLPEIASAITVPLACSYVQDSSFRTQHWYNCYTCGLVWDKGCCTLCALTCHKGHDVSYSRCSSFFCDCGAESNSSGEQNRVSCKCLSPFTKERTRDFFTDDWLSYESVDTAPTAKIQGKMVKTEDYESPATICIVRAAFEKVGLMSLNKLTAAAPKTTWHNDLFQVLRSQFQNWQQSTSFESQLARFDNESSGANGSMPVTRSSPLALSRTLRVRRSSILSIHHLSEVPLVPVRSAAGFEAKLSSDASANSHLWSKLESDEIVRSVMVADSRGRLILAEPCTLVFASAVPAVNTRYVANPLDGQLTRQQMCVLGLGLLKFNVIGMRLCGDNERHLVVWGLSEACVVILKPDWTGIEDTINLVFNLGQRNGDDGNHLVKCEWIPGSESNVVVGCSRFVRIYDVTRTKNGNGASPVIGYNFGFEANLRDVTVVSSYQSSHCQKESFLKSDVSKMFLLLENGRLHVVELKSGENGRLESPADQQLFEPSECVSLSMCGIRSRSGMGVQGSATRTLGQGCHLRYLKQSRTLLYKCSTSCVVALMLDNHGGVEGTFEFLPHVISSEILGDMPGDKAVSGPYTHWTELGLAYQNGKTFFRVCCIGRSVGGKHPRLLCIEFNETESRVGLLSWPANAGDEAEMRSSAAFVGLAAFSTPFIRDVPTMGPVHGERSFLCAFSSDGTLFFYGEDSIDTLQVAQEVNPQTTIHMLSVSRNDAETQSKTKPNFPLTIFETLKNIGDLPCVVFGGRGIGR